MFFLEYSALLSKINIPDIKIDDRFRKDLGDINGLARSIKRHGLLHQIVVLPKNENGKYVCVCGARRIAARTALSHQ